MPQIKFEKAKLDELLASVGNELTDLLKSDAAALAKSAVDDAPGEASEGSGPPTEPDEETADASAPAEASAPDEGAAPPMDGAPEVSESQAAAAAQPDGAPGHEAGEIEPAPTVEALQAEYAKLDPEALKMHYLAAKSALVAAMGAEQSAAPGPEASAPPAAPAPPAAAPMAPEQSGAPMAMGELKAGKAMDLSDGGIGGEISKGKMGKSESDLKVEALEKQLEEQNLALLQLAEVVATPIRKSVKGLSDLKFIERTEEPKTTSAAKMTKAEVTATLREKVRGGKLSKSDKELVSKYYAGSVDATKLEHLLADAK